MIPSITISNASDVPIHQQLFNQIAASILRGEMDAAYGLQIAMAYIESITLYIKENSDKERGV